ncbi:MAG: DNA repair protein RadC [Anaerolineaceae bacterium]|nr:DNA repair protein RadC [Anaerolineaceae bacterium]
MNKKDDVNNCRAYAIRAGDADTLCLMNEDDVLTTARSIMESRFQRSHYLTSPDVTRQYLTLSLANEPREVFGLVFLDSGHGVLGLEILFQGTIDGAAVYPREVVKRALDANAAAVILVHNHPSGNPEPSRADQLLTERICKALETVEIRVLDHLIVAGSGVVSFAERGLIPSGTG